MLGMIPVLYQSASQTLMYVQSPRMLLKTQIYPGPRSESPAVWNRASVFLTSSPDQVCCSLKSEDYHPEKSSKVVLKQLIHTNYGEFCFIFLRFLKFDREREQASTQAGGAAG